MTNLGYQQIQQKMKRMERLTVPESVQVLVEGFRGFQMRRFPSSLSGVSFIRIAGQAAGLDHKESRDEVLKVLRLLKPGGVFLILGHGGGIPCGAVGAKKLALELAKRGEHLPEHMSVRGLLENVSPEVGGVDSPGAEMVNAMFQANKVLADGEFGEIIRRKNITVVAAVVTDMVEYKTVNRDWNLKKLYERHPKLIALDLQLTKGLQKTKEDGIDLSKHYAHSIFIYDPMLMREVLDPFETLLDVGGICCVDARLQPNTPDGYKYLFRKGPNRGFGVTVGMKGGQVSFSYDDEGSITYPLGHVKGVNSLAEHGEKGNGHIVILDNVCSLVNADVVKTALLQKDQFVSGTMEGQTITLAGFDGKQLRISNQSFGIETYIDYAPEVNILTL